jgi:hypothetical protein
MYRLCGDLRERPLEDLLKEYAPTLRNGTVIGKADAGSCDALPGFTFACVIKFEVS